MGEIFIIITAIFSFIFMLAVIFGLLDIVKYLKLNSQKLDKLIEYQAYFAELKDLDIKKEEEE